MWSVSSRICDVNGALTARRRRGRRRPNRTVSRARNRRSDLAADPAARNELLLLQIVFAQHPQLGLP